MQRYNQTEAAVIQANYLEIATSRVTDISAQRRINSSNVVQLSDCRLLPSIDYWVKSVLGQCLISCIIIIVFNVLWLSL